MKIVNKRWILCVFMFMPWHFCIGQEFDSLIKTCTKKDYDNIIACGPKSHIWDTLPMKRGFLLDVGVVTPRMNTSDKIGLHIVFQAYLSKRFTLGISYQQTLICNSSNYGLVLKDPLIRNINLGLITEVNVVRKNRIEFNFILLNGLARNELFSSSLRMKNDNKESESDPDSVNLFYALNLNYFISPGINFSMILFPMKETYHCQLQLYSQIGYRQLIGKTKFGTLNEFSSPFAQVGLRILFRNDNTYFSEWFNQKFKHKKSDKE